MLGRYKKRWLAYLNKENYDHTQGEIDPFEYHSLFLTLAKLFCIMDYDVLPYWMYMYISAHNSVALVESCDPHGKNNRLTSKKYISAAAVIVSGAVAAILFIISLGHFVQNMEIHLMTESGTYLLIMLYKLLITACTYTDKKSYHNLMKGLRFDFHYICTKGIRYRDRFFENQQLTFKACVVSALFTGSIGGGMCVCACISVFLAYVKQQEDDLGRPLPYPFWLFGYDINNSPVYEIIFFLSIIFTFCHTYAYIFMMVTQILWVREITTRADIVRWSLQDLLIGVRPANNAAEQRYFNLLISHRMRDIMLIHHSMFTLMEDYAAVYKKCLLYEQKLAGPIICMTMYCFTEKLDAGEFQGVLLLLFSASVVVVLIPSYLCTFLLEKVQSVSDACWETPFWNSGPIVRPYLVLIMQRSMRPLPIVAAGFEDISLQTYSKMMSRAYSCFNMLRQGF